MTLPTDLVVLDASSILNLYATGRMRDILTVTPSGAGIVEYVLQKEALFVRGTDPSQGEIKEPVVLDPLINEGLLRVFRLESSAETALFVDLASQMDDGEAMTAAIAICRSCSLATDDQKALRILSVRAPHLDVTTTLGLIRRWAEATSTPRVILEALEESMRTKASYRFSERDPHYGWWLSAVKKRL